MHVVILVPPVFAARVEARTPRHRGRVLASEHQDDLPTISARVPSAPPPGDPTAGVREPRPTVPAGRRGAIAVPEPDESEG